MSDALPLRSQGTLDPPASRGTPVDTRLSLLRLENPISVLWIGFVVYVLWTMVVLGLSALPGLPVLPGLPDLAVADSVPAAQAKLVRYNPAVPVEAYLGAGACRSTRRSGGARLFTLGRAGRDDADHHL